MPLAVALRFAYDGSCFASYARNPGGNSVEAALIAGLERAGLVAGTFRSGSRTDAGVSALENVCAAELDRSHIKGLLPSLKLPPGLWATGAATVSAGWNPRHARMRTYALTHAANREDQAAMQTAAAAFVGRHPMHAFAKVEAGRDPVRTVLAFRVMRRGPDWVLRVRGESFLWNQVRRMVGAVLAVGRGDATPADVRYALASGRPHKRFGVAPAEGLALERVMYSGLRWDSAAGHVGRSAVNAETVLRVRLAVASHVAKLARAD